MRILSFLLIVIATTAAAAATAPSIERAWIREAPPGAPVLGGFMSIEGGSRDITIVAARSDDFARVEIHEMATTDGVMKMRAVKAFDVPAGARVSLAPGGEHLMLFEPKRALAAGDTVRIVFELSRGDPLEIDFEVSRDKPAHDAHAGH